MEPVFRSPVFSDLYGRPFSDTHFVTHERVTDLAKQAQRLLARIVPVRECARPGAIHGSSAASHDSALTALDLALEFVLELCALPSVWAECSLSMVAGSLRDARELVALLPAHSHDERKCAEYVHTLVTRIEGLSVVGRAALLVPVGWARVAEPGSPPVSHVLLLALVRHADGCEVWLANAGEGLDYHPARPAESSGALLLASPLRLGVAPWERVCDPLFWFCAVRPFVWPSADHTASLLYEKLLPYLTG